MTFYSGCPRCGSAAVKARNYARKSLSVIGTIVGIASGAALEIAARDSLRTTRTGSANLAILAIAQVLLKTLLGAATGCATGAAVGRTIDENILNNYECLSCGHTFGRADDGQLALPFPDPSIHQE